jgi:hypothetical protein
VLARVIDLLPDEGADFLGERRRAPSRNAFTASTNSVSPRGKVAESALNHAVATGSPLSHQRCCAAAPKRRSRTTIGGLPPGCRFYSKVGGVHARTGVN